MGGMKSTIATRAEAMSATSARPPASLYVAGRFSMRYVDFFHVPDPALWAVARGRRLGDRNPRRRQIHPRIISVDSYRRPDGRFRYTGRGTVFVWTGMALTPLFPQATGFRTLLFLQLVNGAAVSFAWSGVQTLIAQLAEGDDAAWGAVLTAALIGTPRWNSVRRNRRAERTATGFAPATPGPGRRTTSAQSNSSRSPL
jgi:hypothetical protein